MALDINTLFLVTIYVEAILGLLLLFAWVQNPAITAVAWWGVSHLLLSLAIVLYGARGSVSDLLAVDLSHGILFTAFAASWIGARVFDGRPVSYAGLLGGGVLWLIVSRLPVLSQSADLRFIVSSLIIAGYTWATAYELWRGRGEPLVSRWPAIFMFFAQGALFLVRSPLAASLPWVNGQVFGNVWITALSFETLLFTIATAFILLAMAKERVELLHKRAALVDSLTGLANRRAFLEGGIAMGQRIGVMPRPIAILLIDLDRFKLINDTHGHAIGDRVLQIFAAVARREIRKDDLIGRLGGEEFAVALYGVDAQSAMHVAETIRAAFAGMAKTVDGHDVHATCSVGVSVSEDGQFDLPVLLEQADHALYTAKERGRNRCELAPRELPPSDLAARQDGSVRIGMRSTDRSAALAPKSAA